MSSKKVSTTTPARKGSKNAQSEEPKSEVVRRLFSVPVGVPLPPKVAKAKSVASEKAVEVASSAKEKAPRPLKNVKRVDGRESKFNSSLQCGDCLHYTGQAHPSFDAPCAKLGIGSKSEAPGCFTPDVTAFRSLSKDTFSVIATLIGAMTPRQARVLQGLLKYAGSLSTVGLSFLEECYFCLCAEQQAVLEDYMRGYVVGLNKAGGIIVVGTDFLQGGKDSAIAYLGKSSLLTEDQFAKVRRRLLDLGKVRRQKVIKIALQNQYVVPTMDEAPDGKKGSSGGKVRGGGDGGGGGRHGRSSAGNLRKEDMTITVG